MLPIFKFTFYKPNGKKSEPPYFVYITDSIVKTVSVVFLQVTYTAHILYPRFP